MIRDFIDGIISYVQAWKLIKNMRLWPYLIIPGIISLVLGIITFKTAWSYADEFGIWLASFWPLKVGVKIVSVTGKIIGKLFSPLIGFIGFKNAVLFINGPFMSYLSEKIECRLTGRTPSVFTINNFIHELSKSLKLTIKSLIKELWHTILATAIGGLLGLPFLFALAVQAYYAGFSNFSFTLERHFNVNDSLNFIKKHKGLAVGNGLIYMGMLLVPVLGSFIAPSLSTVAATIESLERVDRYKNEIDDYTL